MCMTGLTSCFNKNKMPLNRVGGGSRFASVSDITGGSSTSTSIPLYCLSYVLKALLKTLNGHTGSK